MSTLAQERGCPDCGQASVERALHNTRPTLCPRCRFDRHLARATQARLTRERYCPLCEATIATGSWGLHERSKYHQRSVRVHFAAVLERPPLEGRTTA